MFNTVPGGTSCRRRHSSPPWRASSCRYAEAMTDSPDLLDLAARYHAALPTRIRDYLHARGIRDDLIDTYLLGWNGLRITIPITNRDGAVASFKLAKDP